MSAPKSACDSTRKMSNGLFDAYVISDTAALEDCDRIILYVHGGGFLFGHPLQYRSAYQRWVQTAMKLDLRIAVVALAYREYPSQLA